MVKKSLPSSCASRAFWFLLVAALAVSGAWLALSARSSLDLPEQAQPAATGAAPPALEALARLADEVSREVEGLRGWNFKQPVAKQLATPEQVRQYIERQLAANLPPGEIAIIESLLRTVGLIPPACDLKSTYLSLMENQVAGFYDPETRTLNLVQRPGAMPAIVERMMLAHELTHALDDQYADLGTLIKRASTGSEDSDLVVSSVIEGSATALMLQYLLREQLSGRASLSDLKQYAAEEAVRSKPFLDAPRYFSTILGSYICGTEFLAKGNLLSLVTAPDNRAVGQNLLAARQNLPRSTEQILHPSKYWDPSERDEPVLVSDDAVERRLAQPGRWVVRRDTIGEMLLAILTTPTGTARDLMSMQTAEAWTTPGARGWGGDRLFLFAAGSSAAEATRELKDLRAVWITLWDTAADRDEFVTALEKGPVPAGYATAALGAEGAVVLFGFDEAERTALAKRLGDGPLPMTRGGQPWPPPGRSHAFQPRVP